MPKTVLLVRNAAAGDFGGAETYVVSLAKTLVVNGWAPIVVTRSSRLRRHCHDNGVPVIRGWWWSRQNWSGKRALLFPVYVAWQLILTLWYVGLILKMRANAIHVQSKDDFIAGTFAGRLTKLSVVWTDHMDLRYVFENITMPLRNPVGKFVYTAARAASHIILISNNEKRLITACFSHPDALKNIVVVKNGVIDRRNDYPAHSTATPFRFVLASRIVQNKGISEAITAFTEVFSRYDSLNPSVLIAYGDGADSEKFTQQASHIPSISFFGHTDDALAAINNADVFILPSYQEGFSIALLEATMLGKAIIATDVDSNGEIITDGRTGLLVPAHDAQALAAAMATLLTDEKLRESLEVNARQNYLDHYDLSAIVAREIIPLYGIMDAADRSAHAEPNL